MLLVYNGEITTFLTSPKPTKTIKTTHHVNKQYIKYIIILFYISKLVE